MSYHFLSISALSFCELFFVYLTPKSDRNNSNDVVFVALNV